MNAGDAFATSSAVFSELRRMFPEIPAGVTRLTLTLDAEKPPQLDLTLLRLKSGKEPLQLRKTFRLIESDPAPESKG